MTHTDTLPASPELYGLVTLVFDASPTGAPTNPDEVTLVVTFTAPDGSTYTRNGFYYQAYEYAEWYDPPKYAKYERGEPYYIAGATDWRCRFLPASEGDYTWSAVLTHQDGVENASGAFTVAASGNLGPVQLGATPAHPLKLAGSDEGFFPIGVTCGHYTQATVAYDLSRVAGG